MIDLTTATLSTCACGEWKPEDREECHECDPSFIPHLDGNQSRWDEDEQSIKTNPNLEEKFEKSFLFFTKGNTMIKFNTPNNTEETLSGSSNQPLPAGCISLCRQPDRNVPNGSVALWQGVDEAASHLCVFMLKDGSLTTSGFPADDFHIEENIKQLWEARKEQGILGNWHMDAESNTRYRLKSDKRGMLMIQIIAKEPTDEFADVDGMDLEETFQDIE